MTNYQRVILTGTLTTQSNFHIGTGEEQTENADTTDTAITFNTLCLDASEEQNPYIPASSLRGYLRSIIEKHEGNKTSSRIFGLARQKKDSEDTGNIGLIRVYDARWDTSQGSYQKRIISQTSIDPISNTAKEHHLLSHAIVPSKSKFTVEIEIDKVSPNDVSLLLNALNTLEEQYGGKLGKAKTSGQGKINWELKKAKTLTHEKFIEWLKQNSKPIDDYYQIDIKIPKINPYTSNYKTFNFNLTSQSPLLIIDAAYSTEESRRRKLSNKNNEKADLFEADLYFMKHGGYAAIPGSTLKGWVRARCRKILLTLLNKNVKSGGGVLTNSNDNHIDGYIEQLFGSTKAQGLLHFSDATIKLENCNIHQQTFNAIDRFTGGTLDTALYHVEAVWPKNAMAVTLQIQEDKLTPWMKILLLFVLRDVMQGDLVLGWGKSKGYGRLTVTAEEHSDWVSIYNELDLDPKTLKVWQAELDTIIATDESTDIALSNKEEITS